MAYKFVLTGINIDKIEKKYGIKSMVYKEVIKPPKNTTKISNLNIGKNSAEIVSFLDDAKQIRNCVVSMVNFRSRDRPYKCFWDRNMIPPYIKPIGCPIRYVANKAVKTYCSDTSKDQFTIKEAITERRLRKIKEGEFTDLKIDENSYYETDGIFCSFNCAQKFILENKHLSMYNYSETLLLNMYEDIIGSRINEIIPAPHWRVLTEHGGTLTIEQFRETFNKVEFIDFGKITFASIGRLYEDRLKF